jgi:hypothetical protein
MKGERKPPHIRIAEKEERQKRREKECDRCHEHPCRCDAGEKL